MRSGFELRGFFHRFTDDKDHRHDHAADQERDAPAPVTHVFRAQPVVEANPEQAGEHHCRLLASRLPANEEAFATRGSDFRQVHRNAAQFHAR